MVLKSAGEGGDRIEGIPLKVLRGLKETAIPGSIFGDTAGLILQEELAGARNGVKGMNGFLRREARARDLSGKDPRNMWMDSLNAIPTINSLGFSEPMTEKVVRSGRDLVYMKDLLTRESGSDADEMRVMAGIYLQVRNILFDPKGPLKVEDVLR